MSPTLWLQSQTVVNFTLNYDKLSAAFAYYCLHLLMTFLADNGSLTSSPRYQLASQALMN